MTKWNVSLKVATYKLQDVISRLQGYDITVLPEGVSKPALAAMKSLANHSIVKSQTQLPEPNPGQVPKSQRDHYKPKKKAKKSNLPSQYLSGPDQVPISARPGYKRPGGTKKNNQRVHRGLGWLIPKEDQLQVKALQALQRKGVKPFQIADLVREAEYLGSNKQAVYRAIWQLMAEGSVVRVRSGLYQRTGQSFNQALFAG
jgi:hypothetical protein